MSARRPARSIGATRLHGHEAWAMLDAAPDGLLLVGDDGRIMLANSRIEELFGYDRSELLGLAVETLIPDRFRIAHRDHRSRYEAAPRPRAMGSGAELLACRRDGTEFRVEVSLSPVELAGGMAVAASVRDISERVAMEAHTHAVLETIDATRDGVVMFPLDGLRFTYVNQGAVALLGYERAELLSMTPFEVAPDFSRAEFEELVAPLVDGSRRRVMLTTLLHRVDGADLPVEIVLEYPPAAGPDRPRLIVAMLRDISDRLESARALSATEAAFRGAFDDAPVGMAIATIRGGDLHPVRVNDALCKLLGYSREELVGRSLTALGHPDEVGRERDAYTAMARDGLDGYTVEKRCRHADGHYVWVWLHSTVLRDEQAAEPRVIAHVVDLRERRAAEDERRRIQHRIECLADVRATALDGRPLAESLELVCGHARDLGGAAGAALLRVDADGEHLRVIAADLPANRALIPPVMAVNDALRSVLAGEGAVVDDATTDERLDAVMRSALAAAGQRSLMAVPMAISERSIAILALVAPDPATFDRARLAEIETFVAESATAVQLHQARLDATRLQILEDRERLGQDLHDVVIQRLFAAGMGLQSIVPLVTNERAAERVAHVVGQLDESIAELRAAIFHLNDGPGNAARDKIETVIEDAIPRLGFRPLLEIEGDPSEVSDEIVTEVLPVINEALSNIARHAEASRAHVRVEVVGRGLRLTVVDDGVGIDLDAPRGRGLDNLEARANRVGGTAWVVADPEGGTVLTWTAGS